MRIKAEKLLKNRHLLRPSSRDVAFRYFDLGEHLTPDYLNASQTKFHALYLENCVLVITSYIGFYLTFPKKSAPPFE